MTDSTITQRYLASPAVLLLALMMLAQTLCDGNNDLARANMLHGISTLLGGALIATGWFRGHRGWLFVYAPLAVALAVAGTPEPARGPAHLSIGAVVAHSSLALSTLFRMLPKPPWLEPARA